MVTPDEVIHQSLRLRIMATLNALKHDDKMQFARLRAVLDATDGNLSAHLATLEGVGYVAIEKDFVARRPRTRVFITKKGRAALARHMTYLHALLDNPPTMRAAE